MSLSGNGSGWFCGIIGTKYGEPIDIHCRGIEFHRECVRLLVDICGVNHKIMLHGWNGCGEVLSFF